MSFDRRPMPPVSEVCDLLGVTAGELARELEISVVFLRS